MIPSNFYRPQRSWGKVIFSEACVKNSVGGACMAGGHAWWGVCVAGRHAWQVGVCVWQGVVHGGGHVWQGVHGGCAWWGTCMVGDMHGGGGMYGMQSISGQYTSYWNAFLLAI